ARQEKAAAAVSECTFSPSILPRSRRLAQKHTTSVRLPQAEAHRIGLDTRPTRVEDQLLASAARSLQKRYEQFELANMEECPGYPEITAKAAALKRPGTASERLYQDSEARSRRLENKRREEEEAIRQARRPSVTDAARSLRDPSVRIEQSLLSRAEVAKAKFADSVRALVEDEEQLHVP
ncbi:hypothetical protein KIPB_013391, partial [Kipferlia bialata]